MSAGSVLPRAEAIRRRLASRPLIAAAAAALFLLIIALLTATLSPLFRVRRVEVTGNDRLSRREVIRLTGLGDGSNALFLNEGAIERRLLEQPWVASATVSTSLPSTVDIRIQERTPVGVVARGAGLALVAGDGTILGQAASGRGYPTIVPATGGAGLAGPASVLAPMSARLRAMIAEVALDRDGTVLLRLASGIAVEYGPLSERAAKAAALEAILGWAEREGTALDYVDVRFPSAPTVRTRGGS